MGIVKKLPPIIILVALLILVRLPYLSLPLDRDEGAYAYIGWLWTKGEGMPYLSVFDHKPPLPYLLYGVASAVGGNNFQSIRVLTLTYNLAVISLFYYLVSKLSGRLLALVSTLLVGVYLSSIRLEASHFNTEIQMMLPLLIFIFLIWKLAKQKRRSFLLAIIAGITGGASVLFKPVAVLVIIGITLWFLVSQKRAKEVFAITLGFLTPLLFFVLYFWQNGAINEAFRYLIFYNQEYTKAGFDQLTRASSVSASLNWLTKIPLTLVPFFLLSLFTLIFMGRKKAVIWWLAAILIVASWAGAKMGGTREFPHYYLPLVLGMGLTITLFFSKLLKAGKKTAVAVIAALLVLWVVLPEFKYWHGSSLAILREQFGTQSEWFADAPTVAEWIRSNTSPKENLLVWANEPEIYYYSGKIAPTQFINFYGFFYLPDEESKWLEEITRNPPDWIVTYANDPPSFLTLSKFLAKTRSYEEHERIGTYIVFKNVTH